MPLFARDSPALRVLTQDELLHHISGFMRGVPFVVGAFAVREAQRGAQERANLQVTAGTTLYPQPRGYLPQLAIIRADLDMLERLLQVSLLPEHKRNPRLEFFEVIRCAVMFNRLEVLRWLGEHCNLTEYEFEGNLLNYAIHYSGDVAVLDWLHGHVPRQFVHIRPWQLCFAASRGNLTAARKGAAKKKHQDVVQYLSGIMADNVWSCNPRRHEGDGPRRCQKNEYALVLQRRPSRLLRSNSKVRKVEGGFFARMFGSDTGRREPTRLCSRDVSVVHRTSESLSTHEVMT
ncbi:hypothetical protein PRIC2_010388 [Phytophthora ramorum]